MKPLKEKLYSGRRARHLSPLVRYEAVPYDFCDAKNADGIMESSNEFTIEFNIII